MTSDDSYGILDLEAGSEPEDYALEEFSRNGYTILSSEISDQALIAFATALDEALSEQENEFGGREQLAVINDADIVRCPMAYDLTFMELALNPTLLGFVTRILGEKYVLLMQNGVLNQPDRGQHQSKWHRDLNYQHWTSSKCQALSALFCIDPFRSDNGASWILRGSHRFEAFPSAQFIGRYSEQILAPAGSIIVMDAMLFHRAGTNRSDTTRRAVNHVIGRPFMSQQIDIPRALRSMQPEFDASEMGDFQHYLGYRWNAKPDVVSWRRDKAKK